MMALCQVDDDWNGFNFVNFEKALNKSHQDVEIILEIILIWNKLSSIIHLIWLEVNIDYIAGGLNYLRLKWLAPPLNRDWGLQDESFTNSNLNWWIISLQLIIDFHIWWGFWDAPHQAN